MHIQCPNGHVLAVPETHAGKKVQCPACQTVMLVPVPPAAAPPVAQLIEEGPARRARRDDDYDDRPRGRRDDDRYADEEDEYADPRDSKIAERERLRKVRLGIGFHLAKVYVGVIGTILLFALGFIFARQIANPRPGIPRDMLGGAAIAGKAMPIIILGVIFNLTVAGLGIAGSALCLFAPRRVGATGAIIVSLVLEVAVLVMSIASSFLTLGPAATSILGWAILLSWTAGFVCFFLYLKQVALFKKKRWLADNTSGVMWFAIILTFSGFVGGIVMTAVFMLVGGGGGGADVGAVLFAVLVICLIIAGLIWLVRYVRLLHDFRNVLP